jgi:hypothetical protein
MMNCCFWMGRRFSPVSAGRNTWAMGIEAGSLSHKKKDYGLLWERHPAAKPIPQKEVLGARICIANRLKR